MRGVALNDPQLQMRLHAKNRGGTVATTLSMILMIIMASYFLLPLYWILVSITKDSSQLFTTPMLLPPSKWSLVANLKWLDSFQGGVFWRWMINSAVYAICTASLSTLVCAMGGYALSKYAFRFNRFIYGVIISALMVPGAAMTIPIFFLVKLFGLINTYPGVILPMIASPFGLYFMSTYIKSTMPTELIDSGKVDGASDYKIFFKIAIPVLSPGLITLFLITFIGTWNNYFLPLVLLNDSNLYPVTVGMSVWLSNLMLNSSGNTVPLYPLIMTGTFITILPMAVVFLFLRKFIVNGVANGAIKG
ncbi:MAG: carbohydrate ABC transporter permease [Alicyclobacillus sp.]|nr:carbohydrate ABC transporter permease [Alicyclobacillus sp.]